MSVPTGATPLGHSLYLFRSKIKTTECVIACHGGFKSENRLFTVPDGVTINFYIWHGESLIDPRVEMFGWTLEGDSIAESLTGGLSCYNYILEKDSGQDNDAAAQYERISTKIRESNLQRWRAPTFQSPALRNTTLANNVPRHVVTIRHRRFHSAMTLSRVISEVRDALPSVTTFHCKFCRADKRKGAENPSYELGQRKQSNITY
jgi:hypothetical protein